MSFNDLFRHLMRGKGCRNEDHFLKAKDLSNLFRSSEVTQMDRIESPPEQPNPPLSTPRFDPPPPLTQLKFEIRISKF
jgi:hypothetical protein